MEPCPEAREFVVTDAALVAAWERHNAESLVELACTVPAGSFRAREVTVDLDGLRLARVAGTPHAVARDATMVRERPVGAIAAYAAVRGEARVEQDGRQVVVRPGQLLLCDADRPLARAFGHGLEELAVTVPRSRLARLGAPAALAAPRVVDAGGRAADPYARALVRLVGRALTAEAPVPAREDAVLELVAVLASGERGSLALAHRAAARSFVDDHLTDPGLSAADVAAGAGISERHLSRVLADAGTSVPRLVLDRRLDLARALLLAGTAQRTVDVAARCGFSSASYFSQAFRRRFGVTAGEVRLSGRGRSAARR